MAKTEREAITAEEMAKIDQKATEFGIPSLLLMENAGSAVARTAVRKFGSNIRVAVFAGPGNNGGDGFVAARHLASMGAEVEVFLIGDHRKIRTKEARLNWDIIRKMRRNIRTHTIIEGDDLQRRKRLIERADVIIDAMLGSGLRGPLRDPFASAVRLINELRVPVISVDTPTGLDPSTGEVAGMAVRATCTMTFHRIKRGLIGNEEYTGEVVVASLGIPPEVEAAVIGERPKPSVHTEPLRGEPILASACLLGINCRYDGRNSLNKKVVALAKEKTLIPVCPEQLGGLGTPRDYMWISGGKGSDVLDGRARVLNAKNEDVTESLIRGAREVLKIARAWGAKKAILKARSPSCGCWKIYGDKGKLIDGDGVTAALLKREGIKIITEEEL